MRSLFDKKYRKLNDLNFLIIDWWRNWAELTSDRDRPVVLPVKHRSKLNVQKSTSR